MTERWEDIWKIEGIKKDIALLGISGIALIISIFDLLPLPFDASWVAIILCGMPIIWDAAIGLVTKFDVKADVLVSIALIASVVVGENFAAGEVAFIMQLGALLEDMTVAKARAGIEKLVHLTPQTARVVKNEFEEIMPADQVRIGDILRIIPGETIPVDGVIISGQTSVNQAVMTGESLPVDKKTGDAVSSGTVNQFGAFTMQAAKVGEDSSIQRMIRLVQSADAGKARIVGIADRWAVWIVGAALTAAILTWLVTGEIIRSVTILVVFCPCALVLATPTAIMAGIGNVTKHGFLVREGDALERLAEVSRIAFDKTGTLTYGLPQVTAVHSASVSMTDQDVYTLAAAAERSSEHPLGKAVVRGFKKRYGTILPSVQSFRLILGFGVTAMVGHTEVAAGSRGLMRHLGITISAAAEGIAETHVIQGCTIMYVAAAGQYIGFLALSDTVRKESASMIERLKDVQVQPVLLTGDNRRAAAAIALRLGIREVHAECLPEDKLGWIRAYQKKNQKVCMIGDGINDAPALKLANVGIAMGGVGSDIAVDAADIVLVDDDVKELPHLLALSKKMMRTIKWNLAFSMILNFVAVSLAVAGILNPVMGALVHNAGSVFVIIHSAFLLKWKKYG